MYAEHIGRYIHVFRSLIVNNCREFPRYPFDISSKCLKRRFVRALDYRRCPLLGFEMKTSKTHSRLSLTEKSLSLKTFIRKPIQLTTYSCMENKSYRDLMIVLMIRVYLLLALRCRERS